MTGSGNGQKPAGFLALATAHYHAARGALGDLWVPEWGTTVHYRISLPAAEYRAKLDRIEQAGEDEAPFVEFCEFALDDVGAPLASRHDLPTLMTEVDGFVLNRVLATLRNRRTMPLDPEEFEALVGNSPASRSSAPDSGSRATSGGSPD